MESLRGSISGINGLYSGKHKAVKYRCFRRYFNYFLNKAVKYRLCYQAVKYRLHKARNFGLYPVSYIQYLSSIRRRGQKSFI